MNDFGKWDDSQVVTIEDLELLCIAIDITLTLIPWWNFIDRAIYNIRRSQLEELVIWVEEGKPRRSTRIALIKREEDQRKLGDL